MPPHGRFAQALPLKNTLLCRVSSGIYYIHAKGDDEGQFCGPTPAPQEPLLVTMPSAGADARRSRHPAAGESWVGSLVRPRDPWRTPTAAFQNIV